MKRIILVLALVGSWSAAGAANLPYRYPNLTIYVSPSGSDTTGDGTASLPWATPAKALAVIRAQRLNVVQNADITVNVSAGTYAINSPLAFTDADNPGNGHHITWISSGGPGLAVLDGTVPVTGWVLYSGSVYRAAISSSLNFWTLYENGTRADMARTPARTVGGSFPRAFAPYHVSVDKSLGATPANNQTIGYDPLDIDPSTWTLADLQASAWSGGEWQWTLDTQQITSRDTSGHKLGLGADMKFNLYNAVDPSPKGSRYFIQGDLSMLTGAGQWYYDRNDSHGAPGGGQHYLYYWARDGAIASQDIRVPVVNEIITLTGTSESSRVSGFTFDGFAVHGTDFVQTYRWAYETTDGVHQIHVQGANHIDNEQSYFVTMPNVRAAAVHARHVDHVVFQNMHVSDAGTYGIYAEGYVQQCTFQNDLIEKVGIDGLFLEGSWPGEGDVNGSNTIFNIKIRNVGEMSGDGVGIDLFQSSDNTVSHLDIADGPRAGVWVRGAFGDLSTQVYAYGNAVSYVKLAHLMQDSGDAGALTPAFTCGDSTRHNVNTFSQFTIDSIAADPSMTDFLPAGVMIDGTQSGWQVFQNIWVTNTPGYLYRNNDASGGAQTITNCSFLANGTADPSFNSSLVDVANIGVTVAFPY